VISLIKKHHYSQSNMDRETVVPSWEGQLSRESFGVHVDKYLAYKRQGGTLSLAETFSHQAMIFCGLKNTTLLEELMAEESKPKFRNEDVVRAVRTVLAFTSWSQLVTCTAKLSCASIDNAEVINYLAKWETVIFFLPDGDDDSNEDLHALIVGGLRNVALALEVRHRAKEYRGKTFSKLREIILQEARRQQGCLQAVAGQTSESTIQETAVVDHVAPGTVETEPGGKGSFKQRCFECGQPGHYRPDCPMKDTQSVGGEDTKETRPSRARRKL